MPRSGDARWLGLTELTSDHRSKLADAIVPLATEHLDKFLENLLEEWRGEKKRGLNGEAEKPEIDVTNFVLIYEFNNQCPLIVQEFTDALLRDLTKAEYPPDYDFSGARLARNGTELVFFDDYQSSRRALRHTLETVLRNHPYAFSMLTRAAREANRFEHPNWAPWSPLHWFERLLEAIERRFDRSALSLEVTRSYVDSMKSTGGSILSSIAQSIDLLGLVEEPSQSFERDGTVHREASWGMVIHAKQARLAGVGSSGTVHATQSNLTALKEVMEGIAPPTEGISMPIEGADSAQWAQWAQSMIRVMAGTASSDAGNPGSTIEGERNPSRFRADAAISTGAGLGSGVPASSPADALTPFILDLLQGMFDHVFRMVGFNPRVRAAIGNMHYALARVVIRDLSFFRDRTHPLRLWIGSLINIGLRINPDADDTDNEVIEGYVECIERSVDKLRAEAETMDRDVAQSLLEFWFQAIEEGHTLWLARHEANIKPVEREEHTARAWRSLARCVIDADVNLTQESADMIASAWSDVLAIEEGGTGVLSDHLKAVVCAICRHATPLEVNPLVNRLVTDALDSGVPGDRIRCVVSHLGRAHVQFTRAPGDAPVFDPRERAQQKFVARWDHDAPELDPDLDDDYLLQATQLRVSDWFGFINRSTGETERMALIWRGEATRSFLFLSLDALAPRYHSLQGVAQELREHRMRPLPHGNALDALIR